VYVVGMALHDNRFPGESPEYRAARDALLVAERDLRERVETVAALRRKLPLGAKVPEDYVFASDAGNVKMSELFGEKDTLVLYSFMFGPKAKAACPMCTSFLDGLNGQAMHLTQRVALAVVARSPMPRVHDFARSRDWKNLRMLSSAENTFNRDYHGEDAEGDQNSIIHVFVKRPDGIHHFYSCELNMLPANEGQNHRHIDLMWPLWNVLDLTPAGRGSDWYPRLSYA
jgi:predicted dithiol-disulfide oxidoreductase (DUF899 family)